MSRRDEIIEKIMSDNRGVIYLDKDVLRETFDAAIEEVRKELQKYIEQESPTNYAEYKGKVLCVMLIDYLDELQGGKNE